MSNTYTATLNEKLLKNLLKEIRILNAFNSTQQKRYLAKEFAGKIQISQTTLRIYVMKGKKGIEKFKRYLPHGITASGKSYWTQKQVDDYWGVA
jgi:response regulator of citrate/malate metabolism